MPQPRLDNLPLEWIRAFEAAGRTGSFTAAAAETGLTQSAISQRISNLERRIGAQLFVRQPRGVLLTVDGEAWLPYVSAALGNLRQSSEALFGVQQQHLTISASASVIELWIAPRLRTLPADARMQLSFKTMVLASDATQQDETIRVRYGTGAWPHAYKAPLYKEAISPVASPDLLRQADRWEDLPRIALSGPRPGWTTWCEQTGTPPTPVPLIRFDTLSPALAAARSGLGIVLASLPLCGDDLASGRLSRVTQTTLPSHETYWMLASETNMSRHRWKILSSIFVDAA